MSDTDLLAALVKETNRIANALEAIASVQAPAPAITRPMADWSNARGILESLGAEIIASDRSGPTRAQYQGRIYVRRSAHDEDGEKGDAIWFSSVLSGNVKDGNVKWGRLLTFRDRKTDALPNGAKKLKVEAPEQKPRAEQTISSQSKTETSHPAKSTSARTSTEPQSRSSVEPSAPPKRAWPGAFVQLVIRSGAAKTGNEAAELLNKSKLSTKDPEDIVILWIGAYNQAVKDNETPEQALFLADTTLPKANREGNGGGHGAR
jgi:hypothetical protein